MGPTVKKNARLGFYRFLSLRGSRILTPSATVRVNTSPHYITVPVIGTDQAHQRPSVGPAVDTFTITEATILTTSVPWVCAGSHFDGPVWTTPPNVVAGGQRTLLKLQLVSKKNQVG